jgi:hypothetical protein
MCIIKYFLIDNYYKDITTILNKLTIKLIILLENFYSRFQLPEKTIISANIISNIKDIHIYIYDINVGNGYVYMS